MNLPGPLILVPLGQSALIAIGSVLATATLSRFAVPRRVGHAMVLCVPVAAGAAGAYIAVGFNAAADLLLTIAVCCNLFVTGGVLLSADRPDEHTPSAVPPSAALSFALALVIMLGGFAGSATTAMLIALTVAALLSLNLLGGQEMPDLPVGKTRPRTTAASLASATAVVLPLCALVGFSMWQLLKFNRQNSSLYGPEVLLIVLAAPAIVVPTLVAVLNRSWSGDVPGAIGLGSGVAVMSCGILLPALILANFGIAWWRGDEPAHMVGLPAISWRLDAPLLLTAGFALLGMRARLLRQERWIGLVFLLLYLSYLFTNAIVRSIAS